MDPRIFRKTSIERMSTPEKLDVLLTIAYPRHWIALLSILVLIGSIFIWAILSSIPIQWKETGVLQTGAKYLEITSKVSGELSDLGIQIGDTVKSGDTIARVYHPDWVEEGENLLELSKVVSSNDGTVTETHAQRGTWVNVGDPIVTILSKADGNIMAEVVLYLPMEIARQIEVGETVMISPEIQKQLMKPYEGTILYIGDVPTPYAERVQYIGEQLANITIENKSPLVEVRVAFQLESEHSSFLTSGQWCTVEFILDRIHPIQWLW